MRWVTGVEQKGGAVQPIFKRLGVDDLHLLRHVAEDIFDHPIDFSFAKSFLSDMRNILVVALDGDQVIAQIVAVVHQHLDAPPDLYIDNLGVAPAWQRRGLGRRLLALAFKAGAEQGAKAAWVGTEEDNLPANALYENTGASAGRFMMFSYSTIEPAEDLEAQ
jgi:aminoglycoside 6'-N-acetyltransferase I